MAFNIPEKLPLKAKFRPAMNIPGLGVLKRETKNMKALLELKLGRKVGRREWAEIMRQENATQFPGSTTRTDQGNRPGPMVSMDASVSKLAERPQE